jgi:hypothetical protein
MRAGVARQCLLARETADLSSARPRRNTLVTTPASSVSVAAATGCERSRTLRSRTVFARAERVHPVRMMSTSWRVERVTLENE